MLFKKCKMYLSYLLKTSSIALMEAASFYGGVHHKRYSGQQETAPENYYEF
jgi:hypothetical protein